MGKKINVIIICILIISFVSIQTPCFAQNMLRKLGRGIANVSTCPFELPRSIQNSFYEDGPVAAGTYGILDGIFKLLVRAVAGVYEIATFPIPLPTNYTPVVEPEFLFSPEEPSSR